MNHNYFAQGKNVVLRPLEKKDIEQLRIWRNDPNKTKYLRQIRIITPQMQVQWFENYLKNPNDIMFAIDETEHLNRMVGSISIYNIEGETAEAGRIQIGDEEAHGRGIASVSMALAVRIAFSKLGLNKVVASVHRENIAAYKSYMKIGFHVVGCHPAPIGGIEDEIEIRENDLINIF